MYKPAAIPVQSIVIALVPWPLAKIPVVVQDLVEPVEFVKNYCSPTASIQTMSGFVVICP